jgi:hypothetical protein
MRENDGGGESNLKILCNHIYKCHNETLLYN